MFEMLANEDHQGGSTFLLGVIILVFAGFCLSMMVERRLSSSSSGARLRREIDSDSLKFEQLKKLGQERSRRLYEVGPRRQLTSGTLESTCRKLKDLEGRRRGLSAELMKLQESVSGVEEDFTRYRLKYRNATWSAAVGESLGNLKTRGGREFQDAVISQVTAVGLEIRHRDGLARVKAPDLAVSLQERFQWNEEERRVLLAKEMAHRKSMSRIPVLTDVEIAGTSSSIIRDDFDFDSEGMDVLRRKVRYWSTKVTLLDDERSVAHSAASRSGQASVPGSLETWRARSLRLGEELIRARAELAAAKATLVRVAPTDPLLRSGTGHR